MKTCRARGPTSPSSWSSSFPARPTKGSPWRSSCCPGASPTNIRSASALPGPEHHLRAALRAAGSARSPRPPCRARPGPRGARLRGVTAWPKLGTDGRRQHARVSLGCRPLPPRSGPARECTRPRQPHRRRRLGASASSARAGRHRAGRRAARGRRARSRARRAAARSRAAATRSALRARRRDPGGGRRRWRAPRRSWATPAARPRSPRWTPPRARPSGCIRCRPSPRRRPGSAAFAGAGCAVAGSTPGRARRSPTALARALGMKPFEIDDEGRAAYHAAASVASNFLVTLQAAAERIAAGAGLGPREARALLAPLVRRTVENWPSSGPSGRSPGPVARGDERDRRGAARGRRGGRARAARPLRRARRAHPRARRAQRCRREDRAHVAELRAALAPERRGRTQHRPRPDDGLPPRGPPVADAPRPRGVRRRRGLAVREPGPVRARRGPRGLPARRGARRRAGRAPRAWTSCSRPPVEEVYPDGLRHQRDGRRPHRGARGRTRPARPRALRRRRHGGDQALQHGRARTWPTSARRTPSRRS